MVQIFTFKKREQNSVLVGRGMKARYKRADWRAYKSRYPQSNKINKSSKEHRDAVNFNSLRRFSFKEQLVVPEPSAMITNVSTAEEPIPSDTHSPVADKSSPDEEAPEHLLDMAEVDHAQHVESSIVPSFHVSPNGQIIWCLRKFTPSGPNEVDGGVVDVCLEPNGICGLAQSWLQGQPGQWESAVLRRVVSLDLGNNRAVFVTSMGQVKVQFGLSQRRPYCQSYTWPCPNYHLLQVALSASGIVWALAVTRSDDQPDGGPLNSGDNEELAVNVLLYPILLQFSVLLPADLLDPGQTNGSGNSHSSPTTVSPLHIKSQLKSSCWIPLSIPNSLQSTVRRLMHYRSQSGLNGLATALNATFQLRFTTQDQVFDPTSDELVTEPPGFHGYYTLGWLISTASQSVDAQGCGFFLPNLNPPYKADDTSWCEVSPWVCSLVTGRRNPNVC
ncbi:unnamed protein product [Echinostoma caproni]|uniref:Enhancer of mRNA-decapping protein 4 n=1 Tax=Echinostoma caproni TaxID=27848 RepID=A0A183AZE9_9TREM|nr:unnamed protein product [Echinostoma caproni]